MQGWQGERLAQEPVGGFAQQVLAWWPAQAATSLVAGEVPELGLGPQCWVFFIILLAPGDQHKRPHAEERPAGPEEGTCHQE